MKKNSLWILLVLLAVVLGACGGGDEVDTSTFKEASAELLGITMGYPTEWVNRSSDEGLQFATSAALFDAPDSVEEGAIMMVTGFDKAMIGLISEEEVNVEDPVALLNMFSKLALEGDETAVVRDEAKAITLNEHAAAQMVIDTKTDAGKELYGQLTAVPNENAIIFIFATTPKAQEEEMSELFAAMYSTIQLTTPAVDSEGAAEAVAAIEEEAAPTEEPEPTATTAPTNTPAPTATTAPTTTPAPTEAPDLAADFTETAVEDIGFAISHPAGWVSTLGETGDLSLASEAALLDDPQDVKEGMMVQVTNLPADALAFMLPADADPHDPVAVLDMFIGLITSIEDESNPTSFTERDAATATTIAGYDAATATYEVSSENLDGLVKFVAISDPDNNRVAFLFAATPLATEEEYLPILEAMLGTIALSEPTAPLGGGLMGGEPVNLYATSAFASTEYGTDSWSAMQAIGEPDTLACGDQSTAWASATSNGVDWLELTYDQTVYVTQINIHQTYNPDQVVLVELITPESEVVPVYESVPFEFTDDACPFMLAIPLDGTILANGVRITVDQSQLTLGWNEIDAVELVGIPSN